MSKDAASPRPAAPTRIAPAETPRAALARALADERGACEISLLMPVYVGLFLMAALAWVPDNHASAWAKVGGVAAALAALALMAFEYRFAARADKEARTRALARENDGLNGAVGADATPR